MNELISHKAVYRTVPATPGLLIKLNLLQFCPLQYGGGEKVNGHLLNSDQSTYALKLGHIFRVLCFFVEKPKPLEYALVSVFKLFIPNSPKMV